MQKHLMFHFVPAWYVVMASVLVLLLIVKNKYTLHSSNLKLVYTVWKLETAGTLILMFDSMLNLFGLISAYESSYLIV